MSNPFYITTAIPYVNAAPHLGHALEFVQADVLARHQRLRGRPVRFLSGTDDNALKNVTAARDARVPVAAFVSDAADRFQQLGRILDLSCDDYIRTSADPRHRPGVEYLWRRCADAGDFYRNTYTGRYCVGCEQFYEPEELPDGRCPEHGTVPEEVSETNWFFRLSRYQERILAAITSGTVRINPPQKHNEIVAFIRAGLRDFSVSRPAARAEGWGIPVPGDADQIIYVWWDALANYLTALRVDENSAAYRHWWADAGDRVHVVGKGIIRFHAVYWLALLLSAGLPLPTTIHVHDYVNVGGEKLSKSTGNVVDPVALVDAHGVDALRWWISREVPLLGDTEYTAERLIRAYNSDLANGLGNLANRTVTLLHRHFNGSLDLDPTPAAGSGWSSIEMTTAAAELPSAIDAALDGADLRRATRELTTVVDTANRIINAAAPWHALSGPTEDRTDAHRLLSQVVLAARVVATELGPFCPRGSSALLRQLGTGTHVGVAAAALPRLR